MNSLRIYQENEVGLLENFIKKRGVSCAFPNCSRTSEKPVSFGCIGAEGGGLVRNGTGVDFTRTISGAGRRLRG